MSLTAIDPLLGRAANRAAFLADAGWGMAKITALPADASFRCYFRLADGERRAMLMDAPPPQEDVQPFIRVAVILERLGYSAPLIPAADVEHGFLILEDFGDDTYTRLIAQGADEAKLYALAVELLIDLHSRFEAASVSEIDPYSDKKFLDEALLLTDWFLPAATGRPTPSIVREEYAAIWQRILLLGRTVPDTLVLRDFHIDNLMLLPSRKGVKACGLLDFQDALIGPLTYDFVSLVEDARRDVSSSVVANAYSTYLKARPDLDPAVFRTSCAVLAAQRHAKVIGIFCRLMQRDGKSGYLVHLPRLWRLIERALTHPALTELEHWMDRTIPRELRGIPQFPRPQSLQPQSHRSNPGTTS